MYGRHFMLLPSPTQSSLLFTVSFGLCKFAQKARIWFNASDLHPARVQYFNLTSLKDTVLLEIEVTTYLDDSAKIDALRMVPE
jgi:hypothetical protein